jgi:hypothetical protein
MESFVMPSTRSRRLLVLGVAGATAVTMLVVPSTEHADAADGHAQATSSHQSGHDDAVAIRTAAQLKFHDAMRKLWEDHVTWTRLAIVSFVADNPDLQATVDRLMANQTDIGDAIKPFYGDAAGDQLTALLRDHITVAVEILAAAKSNDSAALQDASARWYANADEIADLLAGATNLSQDEMRAMMRGHLDDTLSEAVNQLRGNYVAGVQDYDAIHQHILMMSDTLSGAIMQQFPRRFR